MYNSLKSKKFLNLGFWSITRIIYIFKFDISVQNITNCTETYCLVVTWYKSYLYYSHHQLFFIFITGPFQYNMNRNLKYKLFIFTNFPFDYWMLKFEITFVVVNITYFYEQGLRIIKKTKIRKLSIFHYILRVWDLVVECI